MKGAHLVYSFVLLLSAALLTMVLATAQSNPAVHVTQANAPRDAQTPATSTEAQPVPAAQKPPVSFANAQNYNTGLANLNGLGGAVAIADLNGDGKADLVVAESNGMFSVLLGNGDGTFQAPVTYSPGLSPVSVAIADLNGDGKPDVVLAGTVVPRETAVGVLLGNGDGTFQAPVIYGTGTGGYDSVAIADLNGDSHPDLVVASQCLSKGCSQGADPGGVSVLLGNGDGTFQAPANYGSGGWNATSVAIADLNGDGYPDLAVSNYCQLSANCPTEGAPPGEVSVLLGNGDGTFQPAVSYSSGGSWATSVAVGVLTGNGYPDLVATNYYVPEYSVGVLLDNGNGTFQGPVSYGETSAFANSVAIADVNGDGYLDLLVANVCEHDNRTCGSADYDGGITVLLGKGDGTFQNPINYSSGGPDAKFVAVADVNGDGRPDLVALNIGSNTVGVLLNETSYSTTTALTSSPNPSFVNQMVTFTATITSTPPVPNGEAVTFRNGRTGLGTGITTNGVATLTTSFSKAMTYTTVATYSGDPYHKASSGIVKELVTLYSSTTTLSSSPNPSTSGQAVTLTATVSSGAAGGPTGTVTFKNGATALGTKKLIGGTAILTTTKLPVGTLTLTANYNGDAQSTKSSGTTTQTVSD
jgi:Big-like domain-containing protein/VCBS repeat protein